MDYKSKYLKYKEKYLSLKSKYLKSTSEIGYSEKIKDRGVFATQDYKIGDILEICPIIVQNDKHVLEGQVGKYLFQYDENHNAVAFGYCSMYNHQDDNNAEWTILDKERMEIKAKKDIKKGEEIFISYGAPYWKNDGSKI